MSSPRVSRPDAAPRDAGIGTFSARGSGPDPSLTPHPPFRPQVAYGAPVKAFKASAFSVKAARRTGVVAMSAATDDIIEKMKGLTVSARPLAFLGV